MGRVLLAGLPAVGLDGSGSKVSKCRRYTSRTVVSIPRVRRIIENVPGRPRVGRAGAGDGSLLASRAASATVPVRGGRRAQSSACLSRRARRSTQELLPALKQTAGTIERCMPANWLARSAADGEQYSKSVPVLRIGSSQIFGLYAT